MQVKTKRGVERGLMVAIAVAAVGWRMAHPMRDASAASLWPGGAPHASSETATPVVVELFTSEGCSSCPPADDLLRRIANGTSNDGQPIVALSEHVTYWNQLGWADPFSQDAFSSRQDRYGATLATGEVYTPQAVVNGRVQFVGSDAGALSRALHSQLGIAGVPLHIVQLRRDGDGLVLQIHSGPLPGGKAVELWAAVTDDADTSSVLRGENGGRTLRHAAVVRSLTRVGKLEGAGEQSVAVPLPAAVTGKAAAGHHVALLAQLPGQGAIVGAALAPL